MQLSRLGWRVLVFIFPFFSLDWDFWKLLLLLSETSLFLVSLFPLARYYGRESFSQRNCSAFSMKIKEKKLPGWRAGAREGSRGDGEMVQGHEVPHTSTKVRPQHCCHREHKSLSNPYLLNQGTLWHLLTSSWTNPLHGWNSMWDDANRTCTCPSHGTFNSSVGLNTCRHATREL